MTGQLKRPENTKWSGPGAVFLVDFPAERWDAIVVSWERIAVMWDCLARWWERLDVS
jgi:hypothetical protein